MYHRLTVDSCVFTANFSALMGPDDSYMCCPIAYVHLFLVISEYATV